jgi:hypothetical protein
MRGAGVAIVVGWAGAGGYEKDEKRTPALVRHNTVRSEINSFPAQEFSCSGVSDLILPARDYQAGNRQKPSF